MTPAYAAYRDAFAGRRMPFAFVDLDALDRNAEAVLRRAGSKPVRVASKSVRSVDILRRVAKSHPRYRGVMCYHPREAALLGQSGFDDLLVAYPYWHEEDVGTACDGVREGRTVVMMADSVEHAERLDAIAARRGVVLPLCLDLDMSASYPGLHFGVRRSGVRTVDQALAVGRAIRKLPHVRLDGLMGYEAQIAGVGDATPGKAVENALIRVLQRRSVRDVARRRRNVVDALRADGHDLRFVNGGGTGSLESTSAEAAVTEVTAGSAFFAPALFDHYRAFRHEPAAAFAIEVTRRPAPGIVTCAGGGYVASGAAGPTKLPQPWLPAGARLLPIEGTGEVQTPVAYDGPERLALGDPVLFRHAKAGELGERFRSLVLVAGGRAVGEARTYRGQGECFL